MRVITLDQGEIDVQSPERVLRERGIIGFPRREGVISVRGKVIRSTVPNFVYDPEYLRRTLVMISERRSVGNARILPSDATPSGIVTLLHGLGQYYDFRELLQIFRNTIEWAQEIEPKAVPSLVTAAWLTGEERALDLVMDYIYDMESINRNHAIALCNYILAATGNQEIAKILSSMGFPRYHRVLVGHRGFVPAVRWSPSKRILAVASEDGKVVLWSRAGIPLFGIRLKSSINDICWHPGGRKLAIACNDGKVLEWNVDTTVPTLLGTHLGSVRKACYDPSGIFLATGGIDGSVKVWMGGATIILGGHEEGVRSMAWSPKGDYLATGSGNGVLRIWHLETEIPVNVINAHTTSLRAIAWSDNNIIATGGGDRIVKIWKMVGEELKMIDFVSAVSATIREISWSGNRVLIGSGDGTIVWWDTENRELTLKKFAFPVISMSSGKGIIAVGHDEGTISFISDKRKKFFEIPALMAPLNVFPGRNHLMLVSRDRITFLGEKNIIIHALSPYSLPLWCGVMRKTKLPERSIFVRVSSWPNANVLVSNETFLRNVPVAWDTRNGVIAAGEYLIEIATGKMRRYRDRVSAVSIKGAEIATITEGQFLLTRQGKHIIEFNLPWRSSVHRILYNHGRYLILAPNQTPVILTENLDTRTIPAEKKWVHGEWSHDGKYIALLARERQLFVADENSRIIAPLAQRAGDFKWSPSANYIASVCDNHARVAEVPSGKTVMAITKESRIIDLKWSASGRHLALLSGNGIVMILDIQKEKQIHPELNEMILSIEWEGDILWMGSESGILESYDPENDTLSAHGKFRHPLYMIKPMGEEVLLGSQDRIFAAKL